MKNKNWTIKTTSLSLCLFLSIFLMAFSCADHVVPNTPELPEIQTLELNVGSNNVTFKVKFNKLGQVAVTEYGTLYKVVQFGANDIVPTESDDKEIFALPASLDIKSKKIDLQTDAESIFYRAYAKLANGNTIFGEVKEGNLTPQ
ncbi:hypothetical protein DYBT9623_00433 [Dyadobacter sp. CECT 9623]|uniref:Uncharacterized protein n=1 Tax=Dyadobacter linearis TaxID=2823330 RepID=A0ABM8UJN1_9BACT|nr:hypothetical protein [Dyadobacter sp. CECT 9623]CAG5067712.1 hypothetical protein DYBT9623_00433 [Dyadobacter sp. CECT 9623]